MDTTVINIRTQTRVKEQLQRLAEDLGLTVSGLINGLIKQVIRTKKVEFSVEEEIPSPYLIKALKESAEDYKNGDYYSFDKPEDALAFFDKITRKSKKKN